MSILSFLTSPFVILLIITTVVIFPLPMVLNYTIFETIPGYGLQLVAGIIFIVAFILGYVISYSSSIQECDKFKNKVCLKQGLKQAIYSVFIYLIIMFIPFLKSGFTDIGGDTLFSNSIGEGFILGMSNIALTITNFFNSKEEGCKLSQKESDAAYQKIEKTLNSKKETPAPEQISVTN